MILDVFPSFMLLNIILMKAMLGHLIAKLAISLLTQVMSHMCTILQLLMVEFPFKKHCMLLLNCETS